MSWIIRTRILHRCGCMAVFSAFVLASTSFSVADDGVYEDEIVSPRVVGPGPSVVGPSVAAPGVVLGGNQVGTAASSVLKGKAALAAGLGQGALLRSLSATELQRALRLRLENRNEAVEQYYELRKLHNKALAEERTITDEMARKIAARGAPDRLGKHQFDPETGAIYWPQPLDDPALASYRKPIEDTFAKRSSPGEIYNEFDFVKVHNMINLIGEALETISDQMDAKEMVALTKYLEQIDFESRFNASGERVDY